MGILINLKLHYDGKERKTEHAFDTQNKKSLEVKA